MLSIIVAVDQNNAIGYKNTLLWHISQDLKYFKSVTASHPVIMGRNTYLSIGSPLPGRRNIVVSGRGVGQQTTERALSAIKPGSNTSFEVCRCLEELLKEAKASSQEYFIIGGGALYKTLFKEADRLYVTRIDASAPEADTYFPKIEEREWRIISDSGKFYDRENGIEFGFMVYERKTGLYHSVLR